MAEDNIGRARQAERVALDNDTLARGGLASQSDIVRIDRQARRSGDDTSNIKDDDARACFDSQGVPQRSLLLAIFQACDFDDFPATAASSEAAVGLLSATAIY